MLMQAAHLGIEAEKEEGSCCMPCSSPVLTLQQVLVLLHGKHKSSKSLVPCCLVSAHQCHSNSCGTGSYGGFKIQSSLKRQDMCTCCRTIASTAYVCIPRGT